MESYFVQQLGGESGPHSAAELQLMARSGVVRSDSMVRSQSGPPFLARQLPGLFSRREWLVALLLSIFLGSLGIDRFYLGYMGLGVLKLITCGGFGIWWLIDLILIGIGKMTDVNGNALIKD